jgi:hypothetical protein
VLPSHVDDLYDGPSITLMHRQRSRVRTFESHSSVRVVENLEGDEQRPLSGGMLAG